MQLKQEMGQDAVEDEYYNPDRYITALSKQKDKNPKKRRDIDPDFIHEEE
jgi:hypothetical protein